MERFDVQYNGEIIPLTPLASRVLIRAGRVLSVQKSQDASVNGDKAASGFNWDETVSVKQQLINNWDTLSGEEIVARLNYIWTAASSAISKASLTQNLDLWLLKALALGKCLYSNINEIEEAYQHCRHLGKWNTVLIRNNLAATKATRNECLESLNLLTEAIRLALSENVHLKAPFFNTALILHHLHKNGLIFEERYLAIVDRLSSIMASRRSHSSAANDLASSEPSTNDPEAVSGQHTGHNVIQVYRAIAQFGWDLKEPKALNIFQENIAYLSPSLELFESFGDAADKIDSLTAHHFFEKANEFAGHGMFANAIKSVELGLRLDPTRTSEGLALSEKLLEQWRHCENQRMSDALDDNRFDQASNVILDLPDHRLRQANDDQLLFDIKTLDHLATLRNGDELRDVDANQARVIYLNLLKDPNLEDTLWIHVSSKLVEPLKKATDDSERHQDLSELMVYGLHPSVVSRVADHLEKLLVMQAQSLVQAREFEQAIEKYFWALLLPERRHRRDALMRSALFALELFLKDHPDMDSCRPFANPVFLELGAELQERWENNRSANLISRFEKLDNERWLGRKQIDDLIRLLDELLSSEPTTERLLAKLRLPREKAAQEHFRKILAELEIVSKEGDHSKRRDSIFGELRHLQDLAVDFAAGDHRAYAQQITEFVLKTEAYLLQADNERFKHELSVQASIEREENFQQFRNTLRDSPDPIQILTSIGNILVEMQGTALFEQAGDLSIHWLRQQSKMTYWKLLAQYPDQGPEILHNSHDLLARNQSVWSKEFKDGLLSLLADLQRQFEPLPSTAADGPEALPPSVSPPIPEGLLSRFKGWLTAKFR